jgi:hypothetical protein
MPYWAHMKTFLGYFDRLSYLLSQGHFAADVAVVYPVAPYEAEMDGDKARDTAFDLGQRLMNAGINFEFIDNESLARAEVDNGRLMVKDAGSSYQALVVPGMKAVRWPTIAKAAAFSQAGGKVYCVGSLPLASDRAGRDDAELARANDAAFKPACRLATTADAVEAIRNAFIQDVRGVDQTVRALHSKAGTSDIYMVMDARKNAVVEFRAKGAAEWLDPWTGAIHPLRVVNETATGTQVELPLESYEAQLVAFTPGKKHVQPPPSKDRPETVKILSGPWNIAFVPTLDNAYGDFRLPVTSDNKRIGIEGRRFAWARETDELAKTAMLPAVNDQAWEKKLHGYGTQFYVLGPVPSNVDLALLDAQLAKLESVDPKIPVNVSGTALAWRTYDFSWRQGKEVDLGHQGYHGLKRTVTDDFLCLGKAVGGLNETRYEPDGGRYYLWTSATMDKAGKADILISRGAPADASHTSPVITPAAVYVNGAPVADLNQVVELQAGANPILVRYDRGGRGHFVLRRHGVAEPAERLPLSMRWHGDAGVIPFDVCAGKRDAEWFRFTTAPGTVAIRIQARGTVDAWIQGEPMQASGPGRFVASKPQQTAAIVALRIKPEIGFSGGALIPEPVAIETGEHGIVELGDWSKWGILNNYSGGARYSRSLSLSADKEGSAILDLGKVAGTAEVHINGKLAGIKVAPPWTVDATGLLKSGENRIEVLVYNSLANHYQTIPSNYRGNPASGLLGPVQLRMRD